MQNGTEAAAEEFEELFVKLYDIAFRVPFDIKTTEAQHYRRYVLQRRTSESRAHRTQGAMRPRNEYPASFTDAVMSGPARRPDAIQRAPRGLNDGKGFIFISHVGEVFPSGFLPISAGNVRQKSVREIYQCSPLFTSLRDTSLLKGKCGFCEFRNVCGGSRARAFALTGDPLAEEPCCVYQPKPTAKRV